MFVSFNNTEYGDKELRFNESGRLWKAAFWANLT